MRSTGYRPWPGCADGDSVGTDPAPPRRMKPEPLGQDEVSTLRAELRQALQLQRAAYEQMLEAQSALEEVTARARDLLGGASDTSDPAD